MNNAELRDIYNDLKTVECQVKQPHPNGYTDTSCEDRMPTQPYNWCTLCHSLHRIQELL